MFGRLGDVLGASRGRLAAALGGLASWDSWCDFLEISAEVAAKMGEVGGKLRPRWAMIAPSWAKMAPR